MVFPGVRSWVKKFWTPTLWAPGRGRSSVEVALKSVTFQGVGPKGNPARAPNRPVTPATAAWADLAAVGDMVTNEGWADGRGQ